MLALVACTSFFSVMFGSVRQAGTVTDLAGNSAFVWLQNVPLCINLSLLPPLSFADTSPNLPNCVAFHCCFFRTCLPDRPPSLGLRGQTFVPEHFHRLAHAAYRPNPSLRFMHHIRADWAHGPT
eukprot:GGOE01006549.1.p1 GENE.GGOE01006549.1~~GGOE01006549.1.p1  ORF type:complete len:124 (-),score=14.30 GGOE01006549.1:23-394(-)